MSESPREALDRLLDCVEPIEPERIPLTECHGLILREPLIADRASPACDVSAMDGYALRLADVRSGPIDVVGEVLIGREPPAMPEGAALRTRSFRQNRDLILVQSVARRFAARDELPTILGELVCAMGTGLGLGRTELWVAEESDPTRATEHASWM